MIIHAAGGTRAGRCSGSAWIVEVGALVTGAWSFKRLARGGKFLIEPMSSFLAETITLDEATYHIKRILERGLDDTNRP